MAAADNDVITLSHGIFETGIDINKSISIYGAGFEEDADAGTQVTELDGYLNVGAVEENDTLSSFYIGGVSLRDNELYLGQTSKGENRPIKTVTVHRCISGSNVRTSVILHKKKVGDGA